MGDHELPKGGGESRASPRTQSYGAGDGKIGAIVGKSSAAGRELKGKFLKKVPALQQLITAIDRAVFGYKDQTTGKTVKGTGTLRGLDGRVVPVRHRHAALNTLLQGAGAVVCKLWMIRIHDFMAEHGWDHGNDYRQMANIHKYVVASGGNPCRKSGELRETPRGQS